nr:hypothetical protein [Maliibacterium massiliense]
MRRCRIAAVIMMLHGGLMELGGCLAVLPALAMGAEAFDAGRFFFFIVPYLQENLYMMLAMGGIYGALRLTGTIGRYKGRMWGLALSLINCVVTLALAIFMLPAGMMDGLLAASTLVLMLTAYFGKRQIAP